MDSNFTLVERPFGIRWLHKEKPLWIAYYPFPNGKAAEFWQAYRPANHIGTHDLKGRDPWTLDNCKMSEKGYKSFAEAAAVVEAYEWRG